MSEEGDQTEAEAPQALARWLVEGIGSDDARLRGQLGLDPAAEDRLLARKLVQRLAEDGLEDVSIERERRLDPRHSQELPRITAADSSFLGQLGSSSLAVEGLADVRTLVAIMRAGAVCQRRAAVRRLSERISEGRGIPGDQLRWTVSALASARDEELAYELWDARCVLPGGIGRRARTEFDIWQRMVDTLKRHVVAFWTEELTEEPVAALPGDQRANLLVRTRDLPDVVVAHIAAVIEDTDGVSDRAARQEMVSFLRYAGDPRLVPALASVLTGGESELVPDCSRALAYTEDARATAALLGAYQRAVLRGQRVLLAGALGMCSDHRGVEDARSALSDDDPNVAQLALEALESLGTAEDVPKVSEFLEHPDPAIASQAVRTLGRIGDGRAHVVLSERLETTRVSASRAGIEDAQAAIRARMELRGEEMQAEAIEPARAAEHALATATGDPALTRLVGRWDHFIGSVWLLLGARTRAIARFEAAAEHRPGWSPPMISMALTYMQTQNYSQALSMFRRAVEVERARVESQPHTMAAMLQCFLRRAEEVERSGRQDIARGLLEEVLALDLRRAPGALRFEVRRHHETLRARLGHD